MYFNFAHGIRPEAQSNEKALILKALQAKALHAAYDGKALHIGKAGASGLYIALLEHPQAAELAVWLGTLSNGSVFRRREKALCKPLRAFAHGLYIDADIAARDGADGV